MLREEVLKYGFFLKYWSGLLRQQYRVYVKRRSFKIWLLFEILEIYIYIWLEVKIPFFKKKEYQV